VVSYRRSDKGSGLNRANLTKCVVTAELDFTQGTGTRYAEEPTTANSLALSGSLFAKYSRMLWVGGRTLQRGV